MDASLLTRVQERFESRFESQPLKVFSPGRINLIGEHVDYNEGIVIPSAIDKGIVAAFQVLENDDDECIIIADDIDETKLVSLDQLQPKEEGGWINYIIGVVAELKALGHPIKPFALVFGGNIPMGAGLSSSAALENAVVFGLNTLFQLKLSKEEMIKISQRAEHQYVGVQCGIMDQFASMFGKENHFLLLDCRTETAQALKVEMKGYELVLINTNVKHKLSDSTYNKRRSLCEQAAKLLDKKALRDVSLQELETLSENLSSEDLEKVRYVVEEMARVQHAAAAIYKNDLETLGKLLYASHKGLSKYYKVSCEELDFLVAEAKASGVVVGARMMGGGFGGCTINLIQKDAVATFLSHIENVYTEKFGYTCSAIQVQLSQGTQLLNR